MLVKYLLSIIKATLEGNLIEKNSEISQTKLYSLAKFHSIEHLLYYQLQIFDEEDVITLIKQSYMKQVHKTALFDVELEAICDALEQKHIKHMPLKGSIMKHLYPSIEMRSMADLDILFEKNKHKEVANIFKELGYTREGKGSDSNHDVYMRAPLMNVEMHKEMMNEVFAYAKYYETIWDNVILKSGTNYQYFLSNEDFYIFHICHAGKHFDNGGTGIRTIVDEYVYLNKYQDTLNWQYIYQELGKLNLTLFEKNIKNLAFYWFDENYQFTETEKTLLNDLTNFIVSSGTYGTTKQFMIQKGFISEDMLNTVNQSKFKFIVRKIFPTFKDMKRKYIILKKMPFLLPFFWCWRLIKTLFRKDNNAFHQMHTLSSIKEEEINKYKELKDKTGI